MVRFIPSGGHLLVLVLLSITSCSASNETIDEYDTHNITVDPLASKHPSLFSCYAFELRPDEYTLFPNGSAYVAAYNHVYNESLYILSDDGNLTICSDMKDYEYLDTQEKISPTVNIGVMRLTEIGIIMSMICLFVHLVLYVVVPDVRNMSGANLASLCLSLFIGYSAILLGQIDALYDNPYTCVAVAVFRQLFLLSSFFWMFIMAFAVFKSIMQATGSLRVTCNEFSWKKYFINCCMSWGPALAFATTALLVDNTWGVSEEFRPNFVKKCWFGYKWSLFIFFAGPVLVTICVNMALFGISAYKIYTNQMKTSSDSQRSKMRRNHMLYFRLMVIMGVTHVTGVIATALHISWAWYVYAALNTFQGFFIFVTFTCTRKEVKAYFKKMFYKRRRRSEATITSNAAPTFQSYCHNSSSIDKDLDVVTKSEKTDRSTMTVHL